MSSHSWLITAMVALCATAIYAGKLSTPLTEDPIFNKIISTTEDSKMNASIKKFLPDPKIPMADDPRFNKMLPQSHFDRIEKAAAEQLNNPTFEKSKKVVEIKENTIDKNIKSTTVADEEYDGDYEYDYNNDDTEDEDIVTITPKSVSTTTKSSKISKPSTARPAPVVSEETKASTSNPKRKFINDDDIDLEGDDDDTDSEEDEDDDDDDADDEDDDPIITNEPIVCPRDCICIRNMNGFMVATCSRLDAGIQNFSSGITDLEVVNVSPKYPIVLGARFFKTVGLEHVSTIKIVNSFIDNIHPKAFEGLKELYSVNLTNSGITVLHPDTFAENTKLRLLFLDSNDLSHMQKDIAPFNSYMLKAPSVEELSLSRCNLKKLLPTAFNRLESIVFINLANNDLQSLPANLFDKVTNIEELDLSYNKISTLPKNIFNNTSLAILSLKYNQIESKLDFATPEIQKLDLSHNNISSVSSSMFNKLTGLTTLILKGNGIKKIHQTSFFPLKNLRQIDLSYNDLEQVSATLFLVNKELDVIRLNDNYRLKSLPLEGFACESGKFNVYLFDLQNCDISELGDDTFKNMPRMTSLNLAWNNIETLTKEFFKSMTKLIELNLSNNVISELDNLTFLNNRNLKKLNLAGNQMQKISPRMFLPLKDLTELDLSSCDLVEIWSEPMSSNLPVSTVLKNLKLLNVSNNNIVHARHSHFSSMEKLEVLDLSNNHLHCDDGFSNLIQWLKDRKIKAGNLHAGFNAELTDNGQAADSTSSNTLGWDAFATNVCSQNHPPAPVSKTTKTEEYTDVSATNDGDNMYDIDSTEANKDNESIVDDDLDSNEDDDDDYDDDGEIEIKSGTELRDQDRIIAEEIDERIIDGEDESRGAKLMAMAYEAVPFLLILVAILTTLVLITRIVSLLMHRRGERYRQALLASKNSIIYQKLSEEIHAPQTPKFHRYAPINQV